MKLVVTSLSEAARAARHHSCDAALSLLSGDQPTPELGSRKLLRLTFNDIATEQTALRMPSTADVAALLNFACSLPWRSTLLIHCWMGVSRSTAASLIVACSRKPSSSEAELAETLRLLSPTASPNMEMIRIADALLGRNGRLLDAACAIGRGADAGLVRPFVWNLEGPCGSPPARPQPLQSIA